MKLRSKTNGHFQRNQLCHFHGILLLPRSQLVQNEFAFLGEKGKKWQKNMADLYILILVKASCAQCICQKKMDVTCC